MDAWSRKQYAEAETKLDEAVSTLDEMRHEESKAFDNRPIGWQRSQAGETNRRGFTAWTTSFKSYTTRAKKSARCSRTSQPRCRSTPHSRAATAWGKVLFRD
jgi:hypothetical protein